MKRTFEESLYALLHENNINGIAVIGYLTKNNRYGMFLARNGINDLETSGMLNIINESYNSAIRKKI